MSPARGVGRLTGSSSANMQPEDDPPEDKTTGDRDGISRI
jgi:hypothetical protein